MQPKYRPNKVRRNQEMFGNSAMLLKAEKMIIHASPKPIPPYFCDWKARRIIKNAVRTYSIDESVLERAFKVLGI